MSDQTSGVVTVDTGRDITALLNAHSSRPVLLAALCIGESGLKEHAGREAGGCDFSYGLVQQSVCYPPKGIPGFTYPPAGQKAAASMANLDALKAWSWDAANVLADAGPRLDAYADVAAAVLGPSDPRVPLAALCLWNAPNLGGGTTPQAVLEWMAENLPRLDPKHAANRENYRRALAEAEQYRVKEEPVSFTIPKPVREEFPTGSDGDEEYRKSLLEYAVAAVSVDENGVAVSTMQELNPVRYADLGKA